MTLGAYADTESDAPAHRPGTNDPKGHTVTHVTNTKFRIAALVALGTSLLTAAVPAVASSPFVAGWIWIR